MIYYRPGTISVTAAPGAAGKSTLLMAEELSIAYGIDLLGKKDMPGFRGATPEKLEGGYKHPLIQGPHTVWTMYLEDDRLEHKRRLLAALEFHGLDSSALDADRYIATYNNESPVKIAESTKNGITIAEPLIDDIRYFVKHNWVKVLTVDPYVQCHELNENSNPEMNRVAAVWRDIAQEKMGI